MNIQYLSLRTSNLTAQIQFYKDRLGLDLVEESSSRAVFKVGDTLLEFQKSESAYPYHFAINIPAYAEGEALAWLKERVAVLTYEGKSIQDFDSWNAKAIYFYDADNSIVEFIARRNLRNSTETPFNKSSLLYISEIGVPVERLDTLIESLQEVLNIPIYDGGSERFCALGDEQGLFICIDKNVKRWFPTDDQAYTQDFTIQLEERGETFLLRFNEGLFTVEDVGDFIN